MITKEMSIEELVTVLPESLRYLMDRSIKPIVCGEPVFEHCLCAERIFRTTLGLPFRSMGSEVLRQLASITPLAVFETVRRLCSTHRVALGWHCRLLQPSQ